jgi:hypothetical protein
MKNGPSTVVFLKKQSTKSLKAYAYHVLMAQEEIRQWKKH